MNTLGDCELGLLFDPLIAICSTSARKLDFKSFLIVCTLVHLSDKKNCPAHGYRLENFMDKALGQAIEGYDPKWVAGFSKYLLLDEDSTQKKLFFLKQLHRILEALQKESFGSGSAGEYWAECFALLDCAEDVAKVFWLNRNEFGFTDPQDIVRFLLDHQNRHPTPQVVRQALQCFAFQPQFVRVTALASVLSDKETTHIYQTIVRKCFLHASSFSQVSKLNTFLDLLFGLVSPEQSPAREFFAELRDCVRTHTTLVECDAICAFLKARWCADSITVKFLFSRLLETIMLHPGVKCIGRLIDALRTIPVEHLQLREDVDTLLPRHFALNLQNVSAEELHIAFPPNADLWRKNGKDFVLQLYEKWLAVCFETHFKTASSNEWSSFIAKLVDAIQREGRVKDKSLSYFLCANHVLQLVAQSRFYHLLHPKCRIVQLFRDLATMHRENADHALVSYAAATTTVCLQCDLRELEEGLRDGGSFTLRRVLSDTDKLTALSGVGDTTGCREQLHSLRCELEHQHALCINCINTLEWFERWMGNVPLNADVCLTQMKNDLKNIADHWQSVPLRNLTVVVEKSESLLKSFCGEENYDFVCKTLITPSRPSTLTAMFLRAFGERPINTRQAKDAIRQCHGSLQQLFRLEMSMGDHRLKAEYLANISIEHEFQLLGFIGISDSIKQSLQDLLQVVRLQSRAGELASFCSRHKLISLEECDEMRSIPVLELKEIHNHPNILELLRISDGAFEVMHVVDNASDLLALLEMKEHLTSQQQLDALIEKLNTILNRFTVNARSDSTDYSHIQQLKLAAPILLLFISDPPMHMFHEGGVICSLERLLCSLSGVDDVGKLCASIAELNHSAVEVESLLAKGAANGAAEMTRLQVHNLQSGKFWYQVISNDSNIIQSQIVDKSDCVYDDLSGSKLSDFIQQLTLVFGPSSTIDGEQKASGSQEAAWILGVHELAQQMICVCQHLYDVGHPQHRFGFCTKWTTKLPEKASFDSIAKDLEQLHKRAVAWTGELHECHHKFPILKLIPRHLIAVALCNPKSMSTLQSTVQLLLGALVEPTQVATAEKMPLSLEELGNALSTKFDQSRILALQQQSNETNSCAIVIPFSEIASHNSHSFSGMLLTCFGMYTKQNRLPYPFETLWGSRAVSTSTMEQYCDCVISFPRARFCVIGANALSFEARELLLHLIDNLRKREEPRCLLISCEGSAEDFKSAGAKLWVPGSLTLPCHAPNDAVSFFRRLHAPPHAVSKPTVFIGRPATGKSYTMHLKMAEFLKKGIRAASNSAERCGRHQRSLESAEHSTRRDTRQHAPRCLPLCFLVCGALSKVASKCDLDPIGYPSLHCQ